MGGQRPLAFARDGFAPMREKREEKDLKKREIKDRLLDGGAVRVGVCVAEPVEEEEFGRYLKWIADGYHAGMGYMENHIEIRRDPRLLLEGARSIICCAFSYRGKEGNEAKGKAEAEAKHWDENEVGNGIARYARIRDYHYWVRERILGAGVEELLGEEHKDWRICVDSAPILERYWARRAALGWMGDCGALVVPGVGTEVVLAEILTTAALVPDSPSEGDCGHCGACVRVCPTGANSGGITDCNRCLSYLTIEHRGEWLDRRHLEAMGTEAGRGTLFGCDRCMRACPHNNPAVTSGEHELTGVSGLRKEDMREMTGGEFKRRFKGTALFRAGAAGLRRNSQNIPGASLGAQAAALLSDVKEGWRPGKKD